MNLSIIPVAEANINTLMNSISKVVINPLIVFIFGLAVVYFVYGVMQFLLNPEDETIRKTGKQHMLWGVVGMFIMIATFGIMNLILNTWGEKNITIDGAGKIQVSDQISNTN